MAKITVPPLPCSITRERADAVVSYIADHHPDCTAYSHAWSNDWGVTISGSFDVEVLRMTLDSLIQLNLI